MWKAVKPTFFANVNLDLFFPYSLAMGKCISTNVEALTTIAFFSSLLWLLFGICYRDCSIDAKVYKTDVLKIALNSREGIGNDYSQCIPRF